MFLTACLTQLALGSVLPILHNVFVFNLLFVELPTCGVPGCVGPQGPERPGVLEGEGGSCIHCRQDRQGFQVPKEGKGKQVLNRKEVKSEEIRLGGKEWPCKTQHIAHAKEAA